MVQTALAQGVSGQQVQALARPGVAPATTTEIVRLAKDGIRRLAPKFPGTPVRPIRFIVHKDAASMPEALRASLHKGVPGFARLGLDEIHIVMGEIKVDPPNDLRTTVDHELVHILLDQYVGKNGRYVARWFHEGLAQDLSGDGYLMVTEEDLVIRALGRTYLKFSNLDRRFPRNETRIGLAYRQSYSFVSFLKRKVGLEELLLAAKDCGPEWTFDAALSKRLGKGVVVYEEEWLEYLRTGSGAGWRSMMTNCFSLTLLIFGPLLAIAVARRRNREEGLKERMTAEQAAADAEPEVTEVPVDEFDPEDSEWEEDDDGDWEDEEEFWEDEDVPWDDWREDRDAPGPDRPGPSA